MKNDIAKAITIEQLKQQYNLDSKKILSAIEQESNKLTKVENEMNNYIEVVTKEINSLQDQVDGNITTWFFSGIPSLENEPANTWETIADKDKHIGDLYYDKDTGYAYRFQLSDGVYSWQKLTDNDVTEALAIANSAKDTADSKRRTFLGTPTPPYDSGDIWVNSGKIFICQISRLEGDSYVDGDFIDELNYTDDTYAEEVNGKLTVLSGKVTTIETSVDEISQKVEENKYYTDNDGNKQLISSAMTQVTQDVNGLEIKVDNIQLKVLYTWIKYADDENGTNMSSSSTEKSYIGIANNKELPTASNNPSDYVWSRIKGDTGAQGEKGEDGKDAAIQSATEPEDTTQLWYDTINNQLKQFNGTEWIIVNDFSDDISNLKNEFSNYYTKEQMNELLIDSEKGLTNIFKQTGGNNLLKNSALYFKTGDTFDYWLGDAEKIIYSESQSNTAIKLKNNSFKQSVSLANSDYTLSFKYERLNELATASVKINNEETALDEKGTFTKQLTVETNQIELEFNTSLDDSYIIYELMLNTGTEASPWSQYQNEVHTDTVNISKGIEVEATENDTKATMNANGFNVINKNTQANVLKATDTGIESTDVRAEKGTIGGVLMKKVQNQSWITGV